MPYTLAMGSIWFVLALLVGLLIGWLLRSIVAKRQVERARSHNVDQVELERLRGRVSNLEQAAEERDELRARLEATDAVSSNDGGATTEPVDVRDGGPAAAAVQRPPDAPGAAAVLGVEIELDDLEVIEGIGPKIESLCHGIGIRTWHDLATTEVSLLKTMLDDAGPRFRTHDPSTWPRQAGLLAAGRWSDFRELTQQVGRT